MQKIKKIFRNQNIINNKRDLEKLFKFKNFPISMGVTSQNIKDDKFFDMNWKISKSTGTIQLNPLMPENIVYPKNHQNSGSTGALWLLHHKMLAKFIYKYKPKQVFEIGAAHGILSDEFYNLNKNVKWTIVEPNPAVSKKSKTKVIKGFFNNKTKVPLQVDTYVHSHVFEHVYHPHKFMKVLAQHMNIGHKIIFSVPNLEIMLKRKFTNCINFEHTIFLNEPIIEYFLENYGYKRLEKKLFKKDHSIFYAYKKITDNPKKILLKKNYFNKNKKMYLSYVKFHHKMINEINLKLKNIDQTVFLFGAHVFSQYLINFGLQTKSIKFVLDNDKKKQNKRLYGTNIKVKSPKILKSYKDPVVILKAGVFVDEIKKDIINNINKNTKFI